MRSYLFLLYQIVATSLFTSVVSVSNEFRFGAVLSTTGPRSNFLEARNGYQLFIETVNNKTNGRGFILRGKTGTPGFHFKYKYFAREDNSDPEKHVEEVKDLIDNKKIHFLGGSGSFFADDEMRIANASNTLNFHCCVGPDSFYERDYKTVFGIQVSNKEYTRMTIQRLSLENVKNMRIIAEETNPFTRTTCEAAIEYAKSFSQVSGPASETVYTGYREEDRDPSMFQRFAEQAKIDHVEAVIACVPVGQSAALVNAFHDIKHPLKAFFVTVSPTKRKWVQESFSPPFRADNLLSAAQWHKDMKYSDDFFGTGLEYSERYEDRFDGSEPTYGSAGASAVALTLHRAIGEAFRPCDIGHTKGDVEELLYNSSAISCDDGHQRNGYDRILQALADIDIELFYGRVKFNRFRRNVGLVPVTTQVFPEKRRATGKVTREIKAVLPLGYATSLLRFPAENYYKETCAVGYSVGPDPFDRCRLCPRGTVSFRNNSVHCDSCPLGEYMDDVGQSDCKRCPFGSTTIDRGSTSIRDCVCLPGYYNPFAENGFQCVECPSNAICNGSIDRPYPQKGYWMNNTYPLAAYSCDPSEVCPGGVTSECKKGNKGRLCGECDDGHFSIIDKCYECPHGSLIVLLCVALLIGWYVINVIVSRSVASLEMLLGWAQLANVIGDIDLNWTNMLTHMFAVANVLDFDVDILEPSCLIKNWGFKQNFIVQLCLPFVMSLMSAVGYLSSATIFYLKEKKWLVLKGKGKKVFSWIVAVPESKADLAAKWDATIATFLASIDITYVTIAKYCFDVFKCKDIAGVSVLSSASSIECDTSEHILLIVLGIFGIVGYVLGYLACTSWTLYILHKKKAFSDEQKIRRYGFIYQKFELEYYYTPIIIILRKMLFVMVLVYLNDPAFQLGALAIIINASLMIHVFTAPYVDTYIDILFSFLLLALMFEAFGGLMFYSDNLPQANRVILEWIVMLALFLLVLVFAVIFVMEMSNKYHIYRVKVLQRANAKNKKDPLGRTLSSRSVSSKRKLLGLAAEIANKFSKRDELGLSYELLDTFDPSFVHRCMTKDPDLVKDWEKLTNMLEDYVSDQAPTSYLSVESSAKFWRKLVDRLPEIVDFLAVVDIDVRDQFRSVADRLYKDFYLTNKLVCLPLMKILNWRDRAPMLHWLVNASENDREFVTKTIARMFRIDGNETIADMLDSKIKHGGRDPDLSERLKRSGLSTKRTRTLGQLEDDPSPMDHPALKRINTASTVLSGARKFAKLASTSRQSSLAKSEDYSCDGYNRSFVHQCELDFSEQTHQEIQECGLERNTQEPRSINSSGGCSAPTSTRISALKKITSMSSDCNNNRSVSFKDDVPQDIED